MVVGEHDPDTGVKSARGVGNRLGAGPNNHGHRAHGRGAGGGQGAMQQNAGAPGGQQLSTAESRPRSGGEDDGIELLIVLGDRMFLCRQPPILPMLTCE